MSKSFSIRRPAGRIDKVLRLLGLRASSEVFSDLFSQNTLKLPLAAKIHWLEQILEWMFHPGASVETRLHFLLNSLEKNPSWKINFQLTFNEVISQSTLLSLFNQVGIAVEHGLWADLASRLINRFVPSGRSNDIENSLIRIFSREDRINRLQQVPESTFAQLASLLGEEWNPAITQKILLEAKESLSALSIHVAHYGIGYGIRTRLQERYAVSQNSFYQLAVSFQTADRDAIQSRLDHCERDVASVYSHMEAGGVGVDIVNRLETVTAIIERIRLLLKLENAGPSTVRQILLSVIESSVRSRGVREPIRRHFYLLSRKISERNGTSGEHYIARSKSEFKELFWSACGGGIIVVAMTAFKLGLISLAPAPMLRAFGLWIIYAAGFLAMQFLSCTLATKIPSFTASRLAGLIRNRSDRGDLREELTLAIKSQGLALIGNLTTVIPFALGVSYLLSRFLSFPIMSQEYAVHTVHQLDPVTSFAVPLAALTGVQLWLSSLAGGWFENWLVYRQIPEWLNEDPRLQSIFGADAMKRFSAALVHQASGVATNIALGFLFGFTPLAGTLLGLDWNSNHVTISTTGAFFAATVLNFDLGTAWVSFATGLFLIGVMNFFVSFGLALFIATSSQQIRFKRALKHLFSNEKLN